MITSIFLILLILNIFTLALIYPKNEHYDYCRENPNALITGYNVAGTVYASYPNQAPGLGWIL